MKLLRLDISAVSEGRVIPFKIDRSWFPRASLEERRRSGKFRETNPVSLASRLPPSMFLFTCRPLGYECPWVMIETTLSGKPIFLEDGN